MSEEEKKALEAENEKEGSDEDARCIGASFIGFDPKGNFIGDPGYLDAPGRRH